MSLIEFNSKNAYKNMQQFSLIGYNTINANNATQYISGQRAKQGTAVDHAAGIRRICGVNPGPVSASAVGV